MTFSLRRIAVPAGVALLAFALLLGGGVLGGAGSATQDEATQDDAAQATTRAAGPAGSIEALQARLERVPGDYQGWAGLGLLYVDRARVTADPTWYGKAQGALDRSLEEEPEDNSPALTGLATLQAAQHEFEKAVGTARRSLEINDFDASTYGVLTDALTELGRYDEAAEALQQMADLKPDYAALTRVSYARELRGDVTGARAAMQRALDGAPTAESAGFSQLYLGELAWNYGGDVQTAAEHYRLGLERDPSSLPLQAAAAQALRAQDRDGEALRDYEQVTSRVPVQEYLVEHGELLASLGRAEEAAGQLELVAVAHSLLEANGSVVDLETALFEADHGSSQRAVAAAREAYDVAPGNVFAADALAWALHVDGQDELALPYAEQALSLGIRRASFLFHKGMIERSLGRTAEARQDLQEALQVNVYFSVRDAEQVRSALAQLPA